MGVLIFEVKIKNRGQERNLNRVEHMHLHDGKTDYWYHTSPKTLGWPCWSPELPRSKSRIWRA